MHYKYIYVLQNPLKHPHSTSCFSPVFFCCILVLGVEDGKCTDMIGFGQTFAHIPEQSRIHFHSQLIDACLSLISCAEAGCIKYLAVSSGCYLETSLNF